MVIPTDFHWRHYLELNKDINAKTKKDAIHHYFRYGIYEGRPYKKNYNSSDIKILVVIVSCKKHSHLWNEIKARTNNELLIILGSDKNELWYDEPEKILHLKVNDQYDGLPEKMIAAFDFILHDSRFKHITHILKIDDHDNYFNDDIIKQLYHNKKVSESHYIGQKLITRNPDEWSDYHFGKIPTTSCWYNRKANVSNAAYFDGGWSYILSRKALKIINRVYNCQNIHIVKNNEIYEDVMVGSILLKNGVKPCVTNYGVQGDK